MNIFTRPIDDIAKSEVAPKAFIISLNADPNKPILFVWSMLIRNRGRQDRTWTIKKINRHSTLQHWNSSIKKRLF